MSSSQINIEDYIIPLNEIVLASENFNPERLIGYGGFGKVYKGELSGRWNNRTAAIKRLSQDSHQGDREFYNELDKISRFHHENIISFIGYCDEGNERIIVSEYAVNGSLDDHLRDPDKRRCLSWTQRLKICLGAAKGLNYLHCNVGNNHRVIHRDVKSANILLDNNFVAKICDFGLSKLGLKNQPKSQVNTKVAGTRHYVDPTYLESNILRKESDVYSFGVVMFEMLSGTLVYKERIIKDDTPELLMNLVRRHDENKVDTLIDTVISYQIYKASFLAFKKLAYECISFNLEDRPTMDIVIMRIEEALHLQDPQAQTSDMQDRVKPVLHEAEQDDPGTYTSNVEKTIKIVLHEADKEINSIISDVEGAFEEILDIGEQGIDSIISNVEEIVESILEEGQQGIVSIVSDVEEAFEGLLDVGQQVGRTLGTTYTRFWNF